MPSLKQGFGDKYYHSTDQCHNNVPLGEGTSRMPKQPFQQNGWLGKSDTSREKGFGERGNTTLEKRP